MKHFTATNIRNAISMSAAISLMKVAFRQLSEGKAIVPVRTVIDTEDQSGRTLFMPSYSSAFGLFGLKMVSVFAGNTGKNLPAIQGQMMVMDSKTGTPLATFDAEYLTALRTGAASGLATELLSREGSKTLALIGTGAQAETQLAGILATRPIEEVLVYGQRPDSVSKFCTRKIGKVKLRAGTRDDLKRADIICTATTSSTPVFYPFDINEGTHINGIGSFKPTMQEIPEEIIAKASVVVDQRQAALEEAGDIIIPLNKGLINESHIKGELGEIIAGTKSGRTSADEITVFKSVGNAIQDLAIASAMLGLARTSA